MTTTTTTTSARRRCDETTAERHRMCFASRRRRCGSRSTPRGSRLSGRKSIRQYLISIRPHWRGERCRGVAAAVSGGAPSVRPSAHMHTRTFSFFLYCRNIRCVGDSSTGTTTLATSVGASRQLRSLLSVPPSAFRTKRVNNKRKKMQFIHDP